MNCLLKIDSVANKYLFIVLCLFMAGFINCKKKDTDLSTSSVHIDSISPVAGKYDITDTFRGNHFGNSITDIEVFFNNTPAEIIYLSDSMIIVRVPKNAGSGYVSIEKNNENTNGPAFHYIYTVTVSTLAGQGFPGYTDGAVSNALFYFPRGIAIDANDNIYVADFGNNCIRKISADGQVTTVAGNKIKDYRDGPASDAEFYAVNGLAVNGDNLYVADANRLRMLSISGHFVKTIAGNGNSGKKDGSGNEAEFNLLYGITIDGNGNIFATDVNNNSIRKITSNGVVTSIAGNERGYADGFGSKALFSLPGQLTYDVNRSNLCVADAGNFRIRNMDLAGNVFTLAGSGNFGYKDGRFFNAEFMFPTGIAVDNKKNVYVCGEENVIRKIDANEDVTTIAGSGMGGYLDGPGEVAMFNQPIYLVTDRNGTLYVADQSNHCIRKVTIE